MGRARDGDGVTAGVPHAPAVRATAAFGELWLFGTVTVRAAGADIDLGPPKQRALLAILAVHPGQVVSNDSLIHQLWGEHPPRTAAHSVQIYVSDLRKALAGSGLEIVTIRPGYRLDAPADAVDAVGFADQVASGLALARTGDIATAREELEGALGRWREEPLHEFLYDDWARPHIRRLDDLRASAAEELADLSLEVHPRAALKMGRRGDRHRSVP